MPDDPFGALGLTSDASADDVRGARRRLAKQHHPDQGGDADVMRAVNAAAATALRRLDSSAISVADDVSSDPATGRRQEPTGVTSDMPSFTVEALPAETFEALVIVASWLGDVLDDDPPYRLDVDLAAPIRCWCRLDLVPDAGATTVSVAIGGLAGEPPPDIETVRDIWVDGLNRLDWDEGGPNEPS